MKYVKEHEFTYMSNLQWRPCDNQSHIYVTFYENGQFKQDLCIYVGKDDIFEFEFS